jgi:ArsR family transcriptional regulator
MNLKGDNSRMDVYQKCAVWLKAISDAKRLSIIDMLSCGELCACNILEKFEITQPTLSHHMKILCDSGLVLPRQDGKWTYYTLNQDAFREALELLSYLSTEKEDCICREVS